jgi:hypothetical protein
METLLDGISNFVKSPMFLFISSGIAAAGFITVFQIAKRNTAEDEARNAEEPNRR